MKWSLYMGKIAGIKLFLHWTFLILISWIVIAQVRSGADAEGVLLAVGFVLAVFACVTLHELGHALMAKRFHFKTRDITLLPIGGVARLEEMPEKPMQELLVAIAGPAVNVVIAIVLFTVFMLFLPHDIIGFIYTSDFTASNFIINLVWVNGTLVVFNLLPAFPMDGGRVLRALLSFKIKRYKATQIAARIGQFIAIGFVFMGIFFQPFNPFLILIGIFVFLGAQFESKAATTRALLEGYVVRDILMSDVPVVGYGDTLSQAVKVLLEGQNKEFLVMDGPTIQGILTRDEIIKGISQSGGETPVVEVMKTGFLVLDPEQPLHKVYAEMQQKGHAVAPVVEHGQLLGILDMDNILEFMMVQQAKGG